MKKCLFLLFTLSILFSFAQPSTEVYLFDLKNDPEEFVDLGQSADHAAICQHYQDILMDKLTSRRNRIAMDDEKFMGLRAAEDSLGIKIGFW